MAGAPCRSQADGIATYLGKCNTTRRLSGRLFSCQRLAERVRSGAMAGNRSTLSQQEGDGIRRDWSRPIPVGRFGVLLEPVSGEPMAGLTPLGLMTWCDGTDIEPGSILPGWPEAVPSARTEVLAGYNAANLYLRVICHEPALQAIRTNSPDLWRNDHISLCIDPRHDHWRYLHLLVLPDGRNQASWNTVHYGYMPADLMTQSDGASEAPQLQTVRLPDRWIVSIAIPWQALGLEQVGEGCCLGLNVSRWRAAGCDQLMQWAPTYGFLHDARLFGDLYLGQPAAILQEVRLGGPTWGPNSGYARFAASRPFAAWVDGESIEPARVEPARIEVGPYGFAGYHFDYRMDPRDIQQGQLTLHWGHVDGASSRAQASFVFGWKRSVLLAHTPGRADVPARPQDGAAPDFYARMCDYLMGRLPRLVRRDGRYLVGDDDLQVDLLGDDPLMPLAKAIAERIDGQDDQLAACTMILCQPDVLISSGAMARVSHGTNPASVLWTGGTFCDAYSMVLAALMDRLAELQGWQLPTGLFWLPTPAGCTLPWPNHWWGCAWLDRGLVILDAELGRFFYRRDGVHLATASDLFADPSLAEAAGIGLGDYFRLCKPGDAAIRHLPRWRETRPL